MRMFWNKCIHDWKVLIKCIAKPISVSKIECSMEVIEKLAFGCTTITLACTRCGKLKQQAVLGMPT